MKIGDFIKKYKKYIIGVILLSVTFLVGKFVTTIDFKKLNVYIEKIPLLFVGVFAASIFNYVSGTIAWRWCITEKNYKIPFFRLFMYKQVCEMLSIFNPTGVIAGDGLKVVYLNHENISTEGTFSSIILTRVMVLISFILFISLSILYIMFTHLQGSQIYLIASGMIVLLGLIFYLNMRLIIHPKLYTAKFVSWLNKKMKFVTDKMVSKAEEVNIKMSEFYKENPKRFWGAFIFSFMQWIFGALEFYIILVMLNININVLDAIAVEAGVVFIKNLAAFIPGQIGVEEYGNKLMLDIIKVNSNEIWLIATLARRTRQLLWIIISAIFAVIITRKTGIKRSK